MMRDLLIGTAMIAAALLGGILGACNAHAATCYVYCDPLGRCFINCW